MIAPWAQVPLGEITTAQYGVSVATTDDGIVPILGMKNLQGGRIVFGELARIVLTPESVKAYEVGPGDILFNRTNSFDLVGKTSLVAEPTAEPTVFASYLVRLKVDTDKAHPAFVNYFLNSPSSEKRLKDMATPGVSQFNINPTALRKHFLIPLPPLDEQRAICDFLDAWDYGIRQLADLIAAKVRFKQGLMQQLLTGKRRFKGFNDEWRAFRFDELCDVVKQKFDPTSGGDSRPCVELEHIEQASYRLLGTIASSEQRSLKTVFQHDDVLFGKLRPYLRKAILADFAGVCSTEIWALRPRTSVCCPRYLFHIVQTKAFSDAAAVSSGSQMPRAEWESVAQLSCKLPGHEEQAMISQAIGFCDREIDLLRKQLDALKTQKKGLMQKLLTGEVRVKIKE